MANNPHATDPVAAKIMAALQKKKMRLNTIQDALTIFCDRFLNTAYKKLFHKVCDYLILVEDTEFTGSSEGWASGIASALLEHNDDAGVEDFVVDILTLGFNTSESTFRKRAKQIKQFLNLGHPISSEKWRLSAAEYHRTASSKKLIKKYFDFLEQENSAPISKLPQLLSGMPELDDMTMQDVESMLELLQQGMDELAADERGFGIEEVKKLVASLGMEVLAENEDIPLPEDMARELASQLDGKDIGASMLKIAIAPRRIETNQPKTVGLKDMPTASKSIH